MKSIIWGNYKGGVGKTTSVFQVATYFAEAGKKVLLIDLDPQCSLSNICCSSNNDILNKYKADEVFNYIVELYIRYINSKADIDFSLLMGNMNSPVKDVLKEKCVKMRRTSFKNNLSFIPSSISFENCRLNELAQRMEKNVYNIFLLHLFAKDIEELEFDYLFIDCPPTSNILIQSAFLVSDYYIVPTIVDGISAKGVADYISEIEKTRMKFIMNEKIGGILIDKVFGNKAELIGVFETIYKERRGNADNSDEIITLDKNIQSISGVKSLISDEVYKNFRYNQNENRFSTMNIFKYYIGHRDNRTNGESIPVNTTRGIQTSSYKEISKAILKILEDENEQ
jgi:chromosome partitioning protein